VSHCPTCTCRPWTVTLITADGAEHKPLTLMTLPHHYETLIRERISYSVSEAAAPTTAMPNLRTRLYELSSSEVDSFGRTAIYRERV
jgi:hypothetical protein